jgi:hypothetical protein
MPVKTGAISREAAPVLLCLADAKLGTAAAVNPEPPAIGAPRIALNASRAADLAAKPYVRAATGITPVSAAVIGGAGDDLWGWRTGRWAVSAASNEEVCAAAAIDPETAAIDTPCLSLDTLRATDLAGETNVAGVISAAIVATAIV